MTQPPKHDPRPAEAHHAPAHDHQQGHESWRSRPNAWAVAYEDPQAVRAVAHRLRSLPPLVTSWEIERLREQLAQAQDGQRFILHGGDCAEAFDDCTPQRITNKLKILLQMSLVLVHGLKRPVTRIGRFAGQYAKPRTSPTETRTIAGNPVTLPSYFGDSVNRQNFTARDRTPDPRLMLEAHQHAAMTLNFVRALVDGGFADLHHPEYWDLSFFGSAALSPTLKRDYERMTQSLGDGLRFMEALGEGRVEELTRVEFFTSHEALNLEYESAHTRPVPRREGLYNLSCHLPWIGERTRAIDAAHVEYARSIRNPIAVKVGPRASPDELAQLAHTLDPARQPGRLALITRLGCDNVRDRLPPLIHTLRDRPVLWLCDPMHGNTTTTSSGIKTRRFDDIAKELTETIDTHRANRSHLGGLHVELTGDDVTECVGGAANITEAGLSANYSSLCDPRLNYHQALELSFALANHLTPTGAP